jgi:hypothetical protein
MEDNFQPNTEMVTLLASCDPNLPQSLLEHPAGTPLPPGTPIPWDQVNYLLNNKQGTPNDVQAAIWMLIWGSSQYTVTAAAQAMIDDASANGPGFCPGPGEVLAVLLLVDGVSSMGFQDSFIEITLPPEDHYKCYRTWQRGHTFEQKDVTLEDQFTRTKATVKRPRHICNPVDKNGEGVSDPTAHMMCYKIKEPRFKRRDVVIENQFGEQRLTVLGPHNLCVPAEKDGTVSDLNINHFKCYRVRQGPPKFVPEEVLLADQFETKVTVVRRPRLLCNPVDKNGEEIIAPWSHLTCYGIRDVEGQEKFSGREVSVADQFGERDLKAFRGNCSNSRHLCVPSTKRIP